MDDKVHILVIDDDPLVRELISDYLTTEGYNISLAADGEEGLSKVLDMQPDVVLLDLNLPGKDGIQVLLELDSFTEDHPVVVISAMDDIRLAVEALHQGAWDYLVKPIKNMSILKHTVERSLERARLIRENRLYQEHLEQLVRERTKQLELKNKELKEINARLMEEIEQRKKIQKELEKLNSELEERVKERTFQLEEVNRQLGESLEKLSLDEEAGKKIQLKSLPQNDVSIGIYKFNYLYLPSLYLSGDFLDYFQIDLNHIGFYVADVSGHGVSSALITMLLKSMVGQFIHRYHRSGDEILLQPHHLVKQLNEQFIRADLGKYLELYYGVIDMKYNVLRFTNAGFYPSPILISDYIEQFLSLKNPPVGLYPDADYTACDMEIPERFMIFTASDGIFNLMTESRLSEKEEHLRNIARSVYHQNKQPEDLVFMDRNTNPEDDITVLTIKRGERL